MRHVNLLQVSHFDQAVGHWLHLSITESRLNEVELLNGSHLEQISEDLASQVIVITVKLGNLALLDLVDKSLATCVVDFVVLHLQFLQSIALLHQLSNHLGTNRANFIVSNNQRLQLLLLLIAKGLHDNFDALIADVIASKVQNSYGLAVSQSSLELLNTAETNIITLEA